MQKIAIPIALLGGVFVLFAGLGTQLQETPSQLYLAQTVGGEYLDPDSTDYLSYDSSNTTDSDTTTDYPAEDSHATDGTQPDNVDDTLAPTYAVPPMDDFISCPLQNKSGRTIIDFTNGLTVPTYDLLLVANHGGIAARYGMPTHVAPGRYKVSLASYAHHVVPAPSDNSTDALFEQWYLELRDASDTKLMVSRPSRDIAVNETIAIELVDHDVVLLGAGVKAVAVHGAYPKSDRNAVVPLCAALDRIGDVGIDTEESTPDDTKDGAVETAPKEAYHSCPLPDRDGRIIVDFTNSGSVLVHKLLVRADGTVADATKGPYRVHIPTGLYDVRLASYDGQLEVSSQKNQTWFAALIGADGGVVAKTPPSRDIPDWEHEFSSKVAEGLPVRKDAVRVAAIHRAFPSSEPSTFAILCAAFDRVGALPDPAPSPKTAQPATQAMDNAESYEGPGMVSTKTTAVEHIQASDRYIPRPLGPGAVGEDASVEVNAGPVMAVVPKVIGVDSALAKVEVPSEIVAVRQRVVRELNETPFGALQKATPHERELIVTRLLETTQQATAEQVGDGADLPMAEGADAAIDTQLLDVETAADTEIRASTTISQISLTRVTAASRTHPEKHVEVDVERLSQTDRIKRRDGLATIRDTDGDGISDYDEMHLYATDSENPFTAGGVLTDGERLLLGLDPRRDDMEMVVVESPQTSGEVLPELFTIEAIALATQAVSTGENGTQSAVGGSTQALRITGHTKPLSFVTLYIYSTPTIVTVRADNAGRFEYTLDKTLEDGTHELYVTSVNNAGKILAKTDPIPFVKTAQAVEYTPLSSTAVDPVNSVMQTTVTFVLLLLLVTAIGTIMWLGMQQARREEEGKDTVETHV